MDAWWKRHEYILDLNPESKMEAEYLTGKLPILLAAVKFAAEDGSIKSLDDLQAALWNSHEARQLTLRINKFAEASRERYASKGQLKM